MKRIFLIHGLGGHPEENWLPWLKNELEKKGLKVIVPAMPDTHHPKQDAWVSYLAEKVGIPDKDCIFVGHSLGCTAILRYLETLKENQEVGACIFVAGVHKDLGTKEIKNFFEAPFDWGRIKSHCRRFIALHSDNDPYAALRSGAVFRKNLNAEIIIKHMGHFNVAAGITELPVVLDIVLKISK
jgi:predicted alpha/beta hydrolase family esterase